MRLTSTNPGPGVGYVIEGTLNIFKSIRPDYIGEGHFRNEYKPDEVTKLVGNPSISTTVGSAPSLPQMMPKVI